jgi:hypothetical protein
MGQWPMAFLTALSRASCRSLGAHFALRNFSWMASIIHSRRVLPWRAACDFALRIKSTGTTRTFRAVFSDMWQM